MGKILLVIMLILAGMLGGAAQSWAADIPMEFDNPEQQQRYQTLLTELRCLVCQNQTLSDSHAGLAQDLRNEVYRMISAGDDNDKIIDFLVMRYGDFVLYRPPLKPVTLLLWIGPFLLLAVGLLAAYLFVRSRKIGPVRLDEQEQQRVRNLLENDGGGS